VKPAHIDWRTSQKKSCHALPGQNGRAVRPNNNRFRKRSRIYPKSRDRWGPFAGRREMAMTHRNLLTAAALLFAFSTAAWSQGLEATNQPIWHPAVTLVEQ
jgi:hypothetical protein